MYLLVVTIQSHNELFSHSQNMPQQFFYTIYIVKICIQKYLKLSMISEKLSKEKF